MAKTFMESVQEAKAQVGSVAPADVPADALVIDVRDAADIAASGIMPGAVPISLGTLTFKADVTVPPELQHPELGDHDREIVVTCAVGAMASLGAKLLADMGYSNVRYLEGGTNGWKEAGRPVDEFGG